MQRSRAEAVGTVVLVGGMPVTATSAHPVQSIGPVLFAEGWALAQRWLFVIAPRIGAALAAAVYLVMRQPDVLSPASHAERL